MKLNRVYCFFALFCFVYFLEAIGGIYMVSAVQSIERQFRIPSKLSGLMISAGDFGYIPSVVIISYLGSKGNRARWIGGGCLLIALANFLIATPNFLFPAPRPTLNLSTVRQKLENDSEQYNGQNILLDETWKNPEFTAENEPPSDRRVKEARERAAAPYGFCNRLVNELKQLIEGEKCRREHTNAGPFAIIFGALIMLGIGRTMPWSLGVPLIDDNVKRKNLPVYFAGMFFIRILGPIIGFVIGSVCNRLYYTLKPPEGLTPRDPTWIGAWWLGFLVIAGILFGPSLALFAFPNPQVPAAAKKISSSLSNHIDIDSDDQTPTSNNRTPDKDKKENKKKKRSLALVDRHAQRTHEGHAVVPEGSWAKIKDFEKSIISVLKSPIYTGALIGRILDVLAFKGFMVFLPKYLENHYGIPQYKVQMYLAAFGVLGFAVGMMCGSVVMRRFKLEGRRAALFVAVCSLIAGLISFSKITLGCHSIVNSVGQIGRPLNYNYTSECNADCLCDPVSLWPVCDIEGNPYYSACHAGCRSVNVTHSKSFEMHFNDCKCTQAGSTVTRDWCKDDCSRMTVAYFILVVIAGIIGGLGVIPGVLIILRSVPPEHRSISLGFSGFLVSLLATLPSPVLWGFLVDSACLVWEKTCSGAGGNCTIYEPTLLRTRMHVFYGLLRAVALLSDVWVWYFAKNLKLITEENDDNIEMPSNEARQGSDRENFDENIVEKIIHEAECLAVSKDPPDMANRKVTL